MLVRSKVKYLGTWLGHTTILDQYQRPSATLMVKAQLLAALPLKKKKSKQSIPGRIRFFGTLPFSFPPRQIMRKANMAICVALGIRSWVLPTTHWKRPHNSGRGGGGYALGLAGDFLLWCQSAAYVRARKALEEREETMNMQEFRDWVRRKAPKLRLDPVYLTSFSWLRQPQYQWPMVVTSSVVYAAFTDICLKDCLTRQDLLQIPL